jgi:hypothetical protein
MAIIKQISTPFGVPAEYHRLLRSEVISDERAVVLQVAAYASEEARRSGAQPLRIDQVRVPIGQFVLDPREPFYRVLTDWPLSFLHGGEPDEEVQGDTVLPLQPYVPPPLPPSPPAIQQGGPQTVPGFEPAAAPTT